jgi:hypothetical protein
MATPRKSVSAKQPEGEIGPEKRWFRNPAVIGSIIVAIIGGIFALSVNWLRVSDTAERSQVNQRICHQLYPKMSLLNMLKPQEESLEFILPRKGPLDMSS